MWQAIVCTWIALAGGLALNIRGHQLAGMVTVLVSMALLSWYALCPTPQQYLPASRAVIFASPTESEYHVLFFDSPQAAERGGWVRAKEALAAPE